MSDLSPTRILCVEDDHLAARLLQKWLQRAGFSVDLAYDGRAALEAWEQGSYDVLTADQDMPGMRGIELISTLARRGPLPPTIMITGAGNEAVAVEAMKLGADDYIIKDAGARFLELIPSVVLRALEKRRILREKHQAEERLAWESRLNSALADLFVPVVSNASTIADIARCVLDNARMLTESQQGYVAEIANETGKLMLHTYARMTPDGTPRVIGADRVVFHPNADGNYPGLWGHSLNTREAFFTNSTGIHSASSGTLRGLIPIERFLSVPVLTAEVLVGQICLANSERDYTEHDLEAVKRLAAYYALGIQRKRAEEALRESEQRYRTLFESAPIGIGLATIDGRVISANEAMQRTMGYSGDELLQIRLPDIYQDPRQRDAMISVLRENGLLRGYKVNLKRKDGSEYLAKLTATTLTLHGSSVLLAMLEEVTE